MSKGIATVVTKIVAELESLNNDDERERAIAGARAILGMNPGNSPGAPRDSSATASGDNAESLEGISSAGLAWIKRNHITGDSLQQHFHVEDGKATLIGSPIGATKREQSINAYLFTGIAMLLATGKPDFTDKAARDHCTALGCYDSANHSATTTQFGNKITGTKKTGWKLTAPGLTAAAALLKSQKEESN
ncbi:hypothetical protein [Anatilimnocola floriformis]|uniref:hypothetical protein n=1 Tax=Anatilimnocola floriformis TaxID=2948575 RepID=UPI0020C3850C|nr:hypothetical protein [Anatilimnocola floriformis]